MDASMDASMDQSTNVLAELDNILPTHNTYNNMTHNNVIDDDYTGQGQGQGHVSSSSRSSPTVQALMFGDLSEGKRLTKQIAT